MAKVSETIEIKASKKKVFDVITDFEAYPEFLPETKKVTIDKKSKNTYIVTFTIEVVKSVMCCSWAGTGIVLDACQR